MDYEWDDQKRRVTLRDRNLDFRDAPEVFNGPHLTIEDDREDYGEVRNQTIGRVRRKVVLVVWTPRGSDRRRIISMWKCDAEERKLYYEAVAGAG